MKKRLFFLAALLLGALILAQAATFVPTVTAAASSRREPTADYHEGSLVYTPSSDGKSVTISYLDGGETVSYTVPNNKAYLSGGLAGVDDLGRYIYPSNARGVGSVSAEQERYVGLFYFLWHGTTSVRQHPNRWDYTGGIARNLQKIWDGETNLTLDMDRGSMHWFAEPLYGYYLASDEWVLRKHAELLTNAGVDFLYFDATNGVTYIENALRLMSILHELNEQGYSAPGVVFYTNTNAQDCIKQLYDWVYTAERYPDTWFCIDGKPVIVAPNIGRGTKIQDTDVKVRDYFAVKSAQWPIEYGISNNFKETNESWPWIDFHWPQKIYTDSNGENGAINVSIAQHSGSGNFSDSVLYSYRYNRGRSFTANGTGTDNWSYHSSDRDYNKRLIECYNAANADPTLSYQGLNFQEQFDYAIASDAKYILVTGWNEWIAGNWAADDPSRTKGNFVDCASIEYSRDAEMMRGGYFDNYYMQLVYNIQRVKGTAPVIAQDARKPIDVTGSFNQWDDVALTYFDTAGDTADRNHRVFTETPSDENYDDRWQYAVIETNTSGRNDIVASKVIADSKNVYFYIETADNITAQSTDSSWMQVYVNADRDPNTGWYGYDYIVNYRAEGDNITTVAKYTGENGAYGFTPSEQTVAYRAEGKRMMIAVPLSELGIEDYLSINLEFKVADSETVYDEMEDFYCDGDMAPLGRMNFVFSNYVPEPAAEPPIKEDAPIESESESNAESETTLELESESESGNESSPESESDNEADDVGSLGCASLIGGSAALALMILLAGVAFAAGKRRGTAVDV